MRMLNALVGAKTIVEDCASIRKDENVLVVTDFNTFECSQLLVNMAYIIGADVELSNMIPRDLDGQEPTDCIAVAMEKAEIVLMSVSKSLVHTNASNRALRNGTRILSLTANSLDLMASSAYKANFSNQRPFCREIANLFSEANEVKIQSPAGTNLIASAENRKGNAHSCIVDAPGMFSAAPNIEANFAPVEETMEGVFVADASIPYLGIGMLSSPIIFTISNGVVKEIEGGLEAKKIEKILLERKDPSVYNIAQIAVGLNPEIKEPVGYLGCNYDEGAYGTAHIGIGTSTNLGGEVKASTHFDAVMTKPTISLDDKILLENGEFFV